MAPLVWLRSDRESVFENMPTEFGPVTLRVGLASGDQELRVGYAPRYRDTPRRVVLHGPPSPGLRRVVFNGKRLRWDGASRRILL